MAGSETACAILCQQPGNKKIGVLVLRPWGLVDLQIRHLQRYLHTLPGGLSLSNYISHLDNQEKPSWFLHTHKIVD